MDERRKEGYGLVFQSVMRDKNLSIGAKVLYSYLSAFAGTTGRAFPSRTTICEDLGVGIDTYTKYKRELQEYGIIEVKREREKNGVFGRNIFIIKQL